jgi:hypothetical protein
VIGARESDGEPVPALYRTTLEFGKGKKKPDRLEGVSATAAD